jgi:hypothetical protein
MTETTETRAAALAQLYVRVTDVSSRHCRIDRAPGASAMNLEVGLFRSILAQARPLGLRRVTLTGDEARRRGLFPASRRTGSRLPVCGAGAGGRENVW